MRHCQCLAVLELCSSCRVETVSNLRLISDFQSEFLKETEQFLKFGHSFALAKLADFFFADSSSPIWRAADRNFLLNDF